MEGPRQGHVGSQHPGVLPGVHTASEAPPWSWSVGRLRPRWEGRAACRVNAGLGTSPGAGARLRVGAARKARPGPAAAEWLALHLVGAG